MTQMNKLNTAPVRPFMLLHKIIIRHRLPMASVLTVMDIGESEWDSLVEGRTEITFSQIVDLLKVLEEEFGHWVDLIAAYKSVAEEQKRMRYCNALANIQKQFHFSRGESTEPFTLGLFGRIHRALAAECFNVSIIRHNQTLVNALPLLTAFIVNGQSTDNGTDLVCCYIGGKFHFCINTQWYCLDNCENPTILMTRPPKTCVPIDPAELLFDDEYDIDINRVVMAVYSAGAEDECPILTQLLKTVEKIHLEKQSPATREATIDAWFIDYLQPSLLA